MWKITLGLCLFLMSECGVFALAPPPINLKETTLEVDGKKMTFTFDGTTLRVKEEKERNSESSGNLIGLMVLISLLFYGGLFVFLCWKWGILTEATIVVLILFLGINVWWTFKGRRP